MKRLHLIAHNAAAAGDYDPAARRHAAKMEEEINNMDVDELIARGIGWVTDGPLDRDTIVNSYNSFRSEKITDEQAAEHERVRLAMGID